MAAEAAKDAAPAPAPEAEARIAAPPTSAATTTAATTTAAPAAGAKPPSAAGKSGGGATGRGEKAKPAAANAASSAANTAAPAARVVPALAKLSKGRGPNGSAKKAAEPRKDAKGEVSRPNPAKPIKPKTETKHKAAAAAKPSSERKQPWDDGAGSDSQAEDMDVDQGPDVGARIGQEGPEDQVWGREGDPFFVPQSQDKGAADPDKKYLPSSRVAVRDLGVFMRLRGLDVICRYDLYLESKELRPLIAPSASKPCPWWPRGAEVVYDSVRWNAAQQCFETPASKGSSDWKRACVGCVQLLFRGEGDSCKVAQYGNGAVKTHCNSCRPVSMGTIAPSRCKVCLKSPPTYGWPNNKNKTHCADCRKPGMVTVAKRLCKHINCSKTATYGYDGQRDFCVKHKEDDMELGHRMCMRCKTATATEGRNDRATHCKLCMAEMEAGVKTTWVNSRANMSKSPLLDSGKKEKAAARKAAKLAEKEKAKESNDKTKREKDKDSQSSKDKIKSKLKTTKEKQKTAAGKLGNAGKGDDSKQTAAGAASGTKRPATTVPKKRGRPKKVRPADNKPPPVNTALPQGGAPIQQHAGITNLLTASRGNDTASNSSSFPNPNLLSPSSASLLARTLVSGVDEKALREHLQKQVQEAQMQMVAVQQHFSIYQSLLLNEASRTVDMELRHNLIEQAKKLPASLLQQLQSAQQSEEQATRALNLLQQRQ